VSALDFRLEKGGLHFPSLGLWMDPHQPIGPGHAVVVTHAHADHTAGHAEVILTEATRRLMQARMPGQRVEHVMPFLKETSLMESPFVGRCDARLVLLPAGHVLGSAMPWIEAGGQTLLYTGDFKLRHGLAAEPCEPRHADTLVMETTFGRPHYAFPPTQDVIEGILRFCRDALHHEEVPVLLAYSLGKSQEILASLCQAGLPVMLSDAVLRLTRVYEGLGQAFPGHAPLDAGRARGHVVLAPPSAHVPALRRRLGACRVAVLTGWALDPGCRFRHQADAAFPLSDHADFPDLMEMVRRVAPRRVFTLHGFAADFAAHLRRQGIDARALNAHEQLELAIAPSPGKTFHPVPIAPPPARGRPDATPCQAPSPPDAFARFADACVHIRDNPSKDNKLMILADFLPTLPPGQMPHVLAWFSGRALPSSDMRPNPVAWTALRDAACEGVGCTAEAFRGSYLLHGDTAETVGDLWRDHVGDERERPRLAEAIACFDQIASASAKRERVALLAAFLRRCDAHEARHVAKIVTGNLRIGLKDGLLEEAIARGFHADPGAVRRATTLLGDLAEVARLAREHQLHDVAVEPFRPLRVMLASPEPSPAAVASRMAAWPGGLERGAWAEHKYDGIRCQAHVAEGRARLFSRDLKDITPSFPEVAAQLAATGFQAILDGELLAMEHGRPLPFGHLQRRLGRQDPDLFLRQDVPVTFMAFDILWSEGQGLLDEPLEHRRGILASIASRHPVHVAVGRTVRDAPALRAAFDEARVQGHEGLVIKDPASPYLPGRRGLGWVKLKKAMPTLDCVIVGAEYGHGRRRGVLSDYTFALRDADTGRLQVVGKAYSGLTDEEMNVLTSRLLARVLRREGSFHEVEPEVVLEIAFDRIQASGRHESGLALRFPRIVRVRDDKAPDACDTVQAARALMGATLASLD